ncbi:3-(3-hydroxy-phenyl)propionate hydroxylase/anhydrotetracycline monooxygenase/bifunctional hydroxylase/dehydrase [Streptomyces sp. 846.5]|nr:FAD-dependent monooxygenase [Streptomyces sp. 846.5]TDT97620.1 3-(3-hydroxy-phenyl)propionate hydroxylase/anhydrotetracycline monooxygenase/bifunctional hydroxylase/dehydrase [Streptomyces sp. 846.5]
MDADVVIVGAGPTGLVLACELRLAGVRPVVLERLVEPTGLSKALGLIGRSVDSLDHRGRLDRFRERAAVAFPNSAHFALIPLDAGKVDNLGLRGLFIQQAATEELLNEWARDLGVEIRRGHEVTALRQDDARVSVEVQGPQGPYGLRARYTVGCDGGTSVVRKQAEIGFPGIPPTFLLRLGDVTLEGDLTPRDLPDVRVPLIPLGAGYYRVIVTEPYPADLDRDAPMTLDELRAAIRRANGGADLPISGTRWLSRFTDSSRQAARYRSGRVLLAGDAAHIHLPAGGPGLNTGLQDAFNLGWKLGAVVAGWAPPALLDSYHTERHAEGERVLLHTRAQGALMGAGGDARVAALREVLGQLFQYEQPLRHLLNLMYALDTCHDMGVADPHPLAGRWAPDLTLTTSSGTTGVAELLHPARGVLLDLTGTGAFAGAGSGWKDRVNVVTADCDEPPAAALLIRPDGYVAWAAATDADPVEGLDQALTTWFGAPN